MQKYEYEVITNNYGSELATEFLNEMAAKGWRLIFLNVLLPYTTYYFERSVA